MAKLAIGDPAPDLEVQGPDGAPLKLAGLRGERPLVALFLRHFG